MENFVFPEEIDDKVNENEWGTFFTSSKIMQKCSKLYAFFINHLFENNFTIFLSKCIVWRVILISYSSLDVFNVLNWCYKANNLVHAIH